MLIKAISRISHDGVKVDNPYSGAEIQDEEIVASTNPYNLPQEVINLAARMTERMGKARNAPLPPEEQLPPLTAKALDRIKAFSLREDR